MCSYRTIASLESQRGSGIVHSTGVLPWVDIGFLGWTGWEGEEEVLPFI